MTHSQSLHSIHLYEYGGCIQFAPSLELQQHQHSPEMSPVPLHRTLSTPEPRPLRHANSAFGNFRRRRFDGEVTRHQSDPGVSAFHPVISKNSMETVSTSTARSYEESSCTAEEKKTSPKLGKKLLKGWGAVWKAGRRKMSGRENPVSLLAEEEEEEEDCQQPLVVPDNDSRGDEVEFTEEEHTGGKLRASSDMYSDSDIDEDNIMEPIVGQYHLLDEEEQLEHPRPPSLELSSVEVVAEGTGTSLTGLHVLEDPSSSNNAVRPPSVETHLEDIPETHSPAYHPLVDEDTNTDDTVGFLLQLAPQPNSSPDHSKAGSSSPHSRTTASGNSQADFEVRETNRRSSKNRIREEVVVDLDGNATVHSSSTSSSNYQVHSPKIREGAMPGERFFAATPTSGELNICNVTLSPNKSGNRDIMEQLMQKFPPAASTLSRTHSPHTVSSASVSNTSSSGSETKKPLKFVAIKKAGAIIKPRISRGERPPVTQTVISSSYQKPPQSPRKDVIRTGARTPTHTPPPARECASGANTPSSPPVIVDGPNIMRGNWNYREGTKRPYGVRRASGRDMILQPPACELLYQPHELETVRSELTESVAVTVEEGANHGTGEVVSFLDPSMITPEKQRTIQPRWEKKKDAQECKNRNVAVISPDRAG